MEGPGDSPPSWLQPPIYAARRRPSSPLLTPPLLIILFPIIGLILLFFAIPPFISVSSQILAATRVKKSWDSLNVLLVLLAIICGVFARKSDSDDDSNAARARTGVEPESSRWFERRLYESPARTPLVGPARLRRSSSSYPDLRPDFSSEKDDDCFRFFDDFEIDKYRKPESHPPPLRRWRSAIPESDIKVIPVDTFVLRSTTPPATPPPEPKSPAPPPPPPPPPPPIPAVRKQRTYQAVGTTPPPPPPPPPTQPSVRSDYKSERRFTKLERRKSNAAKEIKMVLAYVQTALYNQRRKKKRKNRIIYENADQASPETAHHTAQPPPPPPPPPPSVFHSLFRKASKSKRIHSIPTPPAPPPPPPRPAFAPVRPSRKKTQVSYSPPPPPPPPPPRTRDLRSSGKPPLPGKTNTYIDSNWNFNSESQSPLIPIPPPPPPPFKMPELRFFTRGDFVRISSNQSSRCSSPELEDGDISIPISSTPSVTQDPPAAGDGGGPPVFCPSPDVNVKADTFIARLRDGWRLEKIHSMREKQKQNQNQNVGQSPGPA